MRRWLETIAEIAEWKEQTEHFAHSGAVEQMNEASLASECSTSSCSEDVVADLAKPSIECQPNTIRRCGSESVFTLGGTARVTMPELETKYSSFWKQFNQQSESWNKKHVSQAETVIVFAYLLVSSIEQGEVPEILATPGEARRCCLWPYSRRLRVVK